MTEKDDSKSFGDVERSDGDADTDAKGTVGW